MTSSRNEVAVSGTEGGDKPLQIVVSSKSRRLDDEENTADSVPEEVLPDRPPPSLVMPRHSTLEIADVPTLEERLFDLAGDLWGEERDEQFRMALEVIRELVPCEGAAILAGTLNDDALTVVAASGLLAGREGARLPFGMGAVGLCFDQRQVVRSDGDGESWYSFLDSDRGEHEEIRVGICVPILDDDGLVYGVIELLNPTSQSLVDEDEEAIEQVARVLGRALAVG